LTIFGIANVLAFLGIIAYISVTVPEKAIEIVMNQQKKDISGRIQMLQQDADKAFKTLAKLEEEIPKKIQILQQGTEKALETLNRIDKDLSPLNEQISSMKQSISKLANASAGDISEAVKNLKLLSDSDVQHGGNLLTKIESVKQFASSLADKLNSILKGNEIVERFRVKQISVVDTVGKERAFLGSRNWERTGLFLSDSTGNDRISLTTDVFLAGSGIDIRDSMGIKRVRLYDGGFLGYAGYAGLELRDSNDKLRTEIYTDTGLFLSGSLLPKNYARLNLLDSKEVVRMSFSTDSKDGRALLEMKNAKGTNRISLYENESGYAGLELRDNDNKGRMTITTNSKSGLPSIQFTDPEGKVVKNY